MDLADMQVMGSRPEFSHGLGKEETFVGFREEIIPY
jgi:hypothetical protein